MTPALHDDEPDPASVDVERASVLAAVAELSDRDRSVLAMQFYGTLVAEHPRFRRYFADLDLDRQAAKLSAALQVLARFANDRQQLGREVIRLGVRHGRRGIGYAEYAIFATVLAEVLAHRQHKVSVDRARQIWLAEFQAIAEIMLLAGEV